MNQPRDTLYVTVEYYDGQEEGVSDIRIMSPPMMNRIVADGKTFEDAGKSRGGARRLPGRY
jgi:hypothetical protein